ncbi:mitochondrial import inner membrane translocase subunit Tim23 isoform X2 [Trichogramma pretiosum]|uniref:mitochondrial import inner membrane translocase subunit Tim23 isoform X2 n=1 Tax=Trichogramma pretiosum TaxID=7493 RepID=UPI0006C9B67A|nr:mitochondrial import inner membrane translocase subunit Tim23 isoform X2 [Trichogramma pretiosum]
MIDLRGDSADSAPIPNSRKKESTHSLATSPGLSQLNPYFNYDPVYFPPSQPEFIFPEGAVKQRGRFELAFSQIGAACIIGAGLGGANGFYKGLKATTLAGEVGKLRRTQMINHVMKNGSSLANTFGVVTLMYSGFGVILSWARGTDDSINTVAAATATGMLFKSTAGLKRCAVGGGIGLGIAAAYCLWNNLTDNSATFSSHNY